MILPTSEIAGMTAREKADLVEQRGTQMKESRYEAAIALALLKRSNQYAELGFQSAEHLAAVKGRLEPRDWAQMLSVGTRALDFPEIDAAFRDGRLTWSKIRALIPHADRENVQELIDLASRLTSNQFEREISRRRDPSVGGPTHMLVLRLVVYARLTEFTNGVRRGSGEKNLSDEECIMRLLDELEAFRVSALADAAVAPAPEGPERSRHVPDAIRRQALIRARFVCELCKNRFGAELHHVTPFCDGGTHELDNLVVVCAHCHRRLHDAQRRAAQAPAAAHGDADGDGRSGGCEPDHGERHDEPPGVRLGDRPEPAHAPEGMDEGAVGAGSRAHDGAHKGGDPAPTRKPPISQPRGTDPAARGSAGVPVFRPIPQGKPSQ